MTTTIIKTETVRLDSLIAYRKNPRVGDVDKVAESLEENGQFKPIVVNMGTETGYTNEILAGNHTWLAARQLGWDTIVVSYVDVDDERAARIVLADNRTADVGEYDDTLLADLLQDLPTLTGTGYDDVDLGEMLADLPTIDNTDVVIDNLGKVQKHTTKPEDMDELKDEEGPLDPEEVGEDEEAPAQHRPSAIKVKEPDPEKTEASSIDAQPDQLPGLIQVVDPNIRFELEKTPYDIPRLLPGFIPELPAAVDCWAGPAICEDDGMGWWLYNYSSDSTKGLPWERTFLAFFVFDDRFENWWATPDKMVTRTLNSGCDHAVMPDFSVIHDNPRVEQMYQTYRCFWLGRFMQECGMNVVPLLKVPPTSEDLEWAIAGIPDRPKSLAIQLQTIVAGKDSDPSQVKRSLRVMKEALNLIEPEALLVYTSEAGETALDILRPECRTVIVPTRRRRWQQNKGDWLGEKLAEEKAATQSKTKGPAKKRVKKKVKN